MAVARLPALSLTIYLTWYVPFLEVSTLPDVIILSVISPSTLSVAVAPGSLYLSPIQESSF